MGGRASVLQMKDGQAVAGRTEYFISAAYGKKVFYRYHRKPPFLYERKHRFCVVFCSVRRRRSSKLRPYFQTSMWATTGRVSGFSAERDMLGVRLNECKKSKKNRERMVSQQHVIIKERIWSINQL